MAVCLVQEDGNSHEDTAYTYIWAQSFSYPRAFPEDAHESVLVSIHDARCEVVNVCARAYKQQEDEEERLEVEEGGHVDASMSCYYGEEVLRSYISFVDLGVKLNVADRKSVV